MIKKLGMWIFILSTLIYAEDTFSVDELILKALENSPELKISSSEFEASKKRKDIAFSNYLPKIDLQISGGEVGVSNLRDKMEDTSLILGKLSAKQILYDFGKTGGNYDLNRFKSQSYQHALEQKISDKKMEVKSSYYKVLQSLALIKVNKESVKLNKAQLYRAKRYFEAGIRTKIDVSDAKVRLIKANLELKKSQYNLKLAYATLDKVVGFEELEKNYKVYSQELVLDNLYSKLTNYDLTLKESILFAYKHRQNLKKQQAKIKSTQANVELVSSEFYPSIYLSADYTKQDTQKLKLMFPDDQYQALANLNWNLYAGGSTSASKEEKQIQTLVASSELKYSKLLIKERTTQAYINVNKMKDSVKLAQNLLEVSKEKFDQAAKRYEHGLSDYIELQEARQGYIDSMADLVVDYYSYYNAIAVLDNAIGR
jgi:outer membrane protein